MNLVGISTADRPLLILFLRHNLIKRLVRVLMLSAPYTPLLILLCRVMFEKCSKRIILPQPAINYFQLDVFKLA